MTQISSMTRTDAAGKPSHFTLRALMAFTAFAAMAVWAYDRRGPVGVGCVGAAVVVLLANIFVGLCGARLRMPLIVGTAGGMVLWGVFGVSLHVLGIERCDDALMLLLTGSLAGLVCGAYAKVKHKRLSPRTRTRITWGVALVAALSICGFGWRYQRAREQYNAVQWIEAAGGTVHYAYEYAADGGIVARRTPPYPHWFRNWLGVDSFSDVISVDIRPRRAPVHDLEPLSRLPKLRTISIRGRLVSDLSPLANLKDLTSVSIYNSAVSDLTPISRLPRLTLLNLWGRNFHDISPLKRSTSLKHLSLIKTDVSDLSAVASMTNLELLDLRGSPASDLSPLARLPALKELDLDSTPVSEISPLSRLTSLVKLSIRFTAVNDVTPVASLKNLYLQQTPVPAAPPVPKQRQADLLPAGSQSSFEDGDRPPD